MNEVCIGLVSDTHNLLRPQATTALANSARIIHAGDICTPHLLGELRRIAPVDAVRGNNDVGPWADKLPATTWVRVGDVAILVVHDLATLDLDPAAAGARVVVSGHSHRPGIERRDGVLYVNPGSAGRRRFSLPVSVAHLVVRGPHVEATLTELAV